MSEITSRLTAALADRYTIERQLGEGGMASTGLSPATIPSWHAGFDPVRSQ